MNWVAELWILSSMTLASQCTLWLKCTDPPWRNTIQPNGRKGLNRKNKQYGEKNTLARCHFTCHQNLVVWKNRIYRYMGLSGRKICGRKALGHRTVIFTFGARSLSWRRKGKWSPSQCWIWRKIIAYRTAVLFHAFLQGSFCVRGKRILTCFVLNP